MFNKIKKEITKCITGIKKNPKETFLVLSTMVGCIIGEIIAMETNPGLIGFAAMGGALVGVALAGASIYCCCPSPEESSIDNAALTNERDAPTVSFEPPTQVPSTFPSASSQHSITIDYEAVPFVGTVVDDSKGTKLGIN